MNLPTIRVSPSDLPHFDFLQRHNYLGEYRTEIDKARVRFNLGIPDSYSFKWGNIGGSIEAQTDVIELIKQSVNKVITDYVSPISASLSGVNENINSINQGITNLWNAKSDLDSSLNSLKSTIEARLTKIETDVSLNAKLIALTDSTGATVDLSGIYQQISDLYSKIGSGGSTDLSSVLTRLNTLEGTTNNLSSRVGTLEVNVSGFDSSRISTLEATINGLQSTVNSLQQEVLRLQGQLGSVTLTDLTVSREVINGTTASDDASVIVTATFSTGITRDVTSECTIESSNTTVAIWNNGIDFRGAGQTTFTFTYTYNGITLTKQVVVNVTAAETNIPTQYVGYAPSWSQVLGNNAFATSSVGKVWNDTNTPIIEANLVGFWICTTQTISSITQIGSYNPSDVFKRQEVYNGITYNIYMLGPVSDVSGINVTITTT